MVYSLKRCWSRLFFCVLVGICFRPPLVALAGECPAAALIEDNVSKYLKGRAELIEIGPSPLSGLCQVHVKYKNKDAILYTDPKGEFFLVGQMLEARTRKNLTRESLERLSKFEPEEMSELENLIAFSLGTSSNALYFVTDPQCPYCKRAEEMLKRLVAENLLTVHFILYPLNIHKGAREQCVALICDGKGLAEFDEWYRSTNQCPEGIRKVEAALDFLKQKGISGTPTFIFPDGRYHSGLMSEQELRGRLQMVVEDRIGGKSAEKSTRQID